MFCDGTTICAGCHRRVPAEAGICLLCGNTLEVRTMPAIQDSEIDRLMKYYMSELEEVAA